MHTGSPQTTSCWEPRSNAASRDAPPPPLKLVERRPAEKHSRHKVAKTATPFLLFAKVVVGAMLICREVSFDVSAVVFIVVVVIVERKRNLSSQKEQHHITRQCIHTYYLILSSSFKAGCVPELMHDWNQRCLSLTTIGSLSPRTAFSRLRISTQSQLGRTTVQYIYTKHPNHSWR